MRNIKPVYTNQTELLFITIVISLVLVAILLAGCQGPRGYTIVGPQGTPGIQGQSGQPGQDALPCTAFKASGVTTIACPGSPPVSVLDGLNGAPGTVITPIQFCPGVTPIYPLSFPEYGLVINGQIYGVYSQNGGFLALLPPGTYNSNAVGSSCDFTINADNTISN